MKPISKRQEIINYLMTVEQASITEIYNNVQFSYYCNGIIHTGNILRRMANSGEVVRVKKGIYKYTGKRNKPFQETDKNQISFLKN